LQQSELSGVYKYKRVQIYRLSPNSTWLVTSPRVWRVEPMHFGCIELVEQHGSTRRA